MKCANCGRAIFLDTWYNLSNELHSTYVHLQTNNAQCLLAGRIVYAEKKED